MIDAALALVFEGHVPPSVEQIAERAGVSVTSVFRYFDTLDDLRRATTQVYFERYAHLLEIPNIGEGTLEERIDGFVRARLRLYERNEPMARFVRLRAFEQPDLDAMVHRVRATHADQIRHHFADELRRLPRASRDDLVMMLATLTSFESWDQARQDHGRTQRQLRRAWADALARLLR